MGQLLRQWREHRRLSQLQLSNEAEISTRHLSFIETGRSAPSRDMILHLAEHLELPLRERNQLLLAAGFAPLYPESALDSPRMAAVLAAVRQVITAHEPYPAAVVDRAWNLVDANASIGVFTDGLPVELLTPPVNVLRLTLHPDALAPRIVNLGELRAHLLFRLRRELDVSADPALARLYEELRGYPCDQPAPAADAPGRSDVVVPLRLRYDGGELAFFSTVTTFGTALDITVSELAIESFFPADAATAAALRAYADGAGQPTGG